MERTLYLNENEQVTVYRDGPSIWVMETGRAGRRIPARLIGRVVIIGNVRLETDVITLFTDNDIPVTLMNRAGDSAAVVMPYEEKLARFYEKQKALFINPEMVRRYKDWLYSQRRKTELRVLKRLSKFLFETLTAKGFSSREYRALVGKFKVVSEDQWLAVFGVVSMLFREMVAGYVVRIGLDPHIGVVNRRRNFALVLDICHILEPEIDLQSIQFCRSARANGYMIRGQSGWSISPEGMKDVVHRFENRREQLLAVADSIIDDVFEFMREVRK